MNAGRPPSEPAADEFARLGTELLRREDPELHAFLEAEQRRQADCLVLVASSSVAHPSVLACQGSPVQNVTAEGYPRQRFHAGCAYVDQIEQLAIERAKAAFGARYANVQPHSASAANQIVLFSLLRPGDTILGMRLSSGGHLTHGAEASVTGRYFRGVGYGLAADGSLAYDEVEDLARRLRPKVIICGATAYPRAIDYARFRAIADQVGALLLADITHVAGLVAANLHPSPIEHAHVTSTCTHKQLFGPRGGLLLVGRECDWRPADGGARLVTVLQSGVFPLLQGAPFPNVMAAKARALARVREPAFKAVAQRIVETARAIAARFLELGYHVVSGGTDTHIVLVDLREQGLSGAVAEQALEGCGIIVNRNPIPGDTRPPRIASGIRLGTNTVALRDFDAADGRLCADLIHRVLSAVEAGGDSEPRLAAAVRASVREDVRDLCRRRPLPSCRPEGAAAR